MNSTGPEDFEFDFLDYVGPDGFTYQPGDKVDYIERAAMAGSPPPHGYVWDFLSEDRPTLPLL